MCAGFLSCDRWQLVVDHYPFFELDDNRGCEARDGYRQNLAALREASLAEGIPFWNFFVRRKRQPMTSISGVTTDTRCVLAEHNAVRGPQRPDRGAAGVADLHEPNLRRQGHTILLLL